MTSDLGLRSELIEATPGDSSTVIVEVFNHLPTPARFQIRVVGAAADWAGEPHLTDVLQPGARTAIEITVILPLGFPTGQHLMGLEAVPLNPDGTPSTDQQLRRMADLTVSVGSLSGLHAVLEPTNVTGREMLSMARLNPRTYRRGFRPARSRRGQTMIRLRNRSYQPVQVALSATSPGDEVSLRFDQTTAVIEPGHIVGVRAKVRSSRPLWGRTRRRPFTVIAKSTGHQLYLEGSHAQSAWIRPGAVKGLGILTVLALWASTLALVYNRVIQEDGPIDETAEQVGADGGDGSVDGPGSGTGDGNGGSAGSGSEGDGGDSEVRDLSISAAPVEASGQVTAREPAGVRVRIRSVALVDEISPDATLVSAPRGATNRGVKLLGRRGGVIVDRIVPAEVSTTTDDEGRWAVAGLAGPGFFEIRFAKPGYATRAYVVEVPEDGTPISLDTEMVAGDGAISGFAMGRNGPLGDVAITVTDGTLTFATTTPTTGAIGSWTVDGLTTPGSYLVTARRRGYATSTQLVRLTGGQTVTGVNIPMAEGTGTITGMVRSPGGPLGDVTITATDGETERTTTSLTEGPVGSFSLPELPRPGIYTLTMSAEGWLTQTMEVQLLGDEQQVNVSMVARTGVAYGRVTDQETGAPLGGVGITAVSEDFTYKNTSAPDGRFELVGLEPGSYVIEFSSFEHHVGSALITVGSGALREINIALAPRDTLEPPPNNSLTMIFSESGNITVTERTTGTVRTTGGGSSASFENLPAGVRTFDITGVGFQPATVQFRMGLNGPFSTSVTLKHLVVVDFEVRARDGGAPIEGAHVVIRRNEPGVCPDTNTGPGCQPFEGRTDRDGKALDADGKAPELTDGNWIAYANIVGYALGDITFSTNYDASATTEVELLVDRLAQITLHIREPFLTANDTVDFNFVGDVDIQLRGVADDNSDVTMTWPEQTGTDENGIVTGTYVLDGIPPGNYEIVLRKPGYRDTIHEAGRTLRLDLNDLKVADPVIVRVPPGTSGQVVWDRDGDSVPIAGATVTVTGIRSFQAGAIPTPITQTWTTTTGTNGEFSFTGDDGPIFGDATITVTHPDHFNLDLDNDPDTLNEIDSNVDLGELELTPRPGTIVQPVKVRFGAGVPDGSIFSRLRLRITDAPSNGIDNVGDIFEPVGVDGVSDGSALFQLPNRQPGYYSYELFYEPGAGDPYRFTPQAVTDVYLQPNRTLNRGIEYLDAQASVSGTVRMVTDPHQSVGFSSLIGGARVSLLDADGNAVDVEGDNPRDLGAESQFAFVAIDADASAAAYRLTASLDGYTSNGLDHLNGTFGLDSGQNLLRDTYLRPLGSITFAVDGTLFDGTPIDVPDGVQVTVTQPNTPGTIETVWIPQSQCNPDWPCGPSGRYVVTGLDHESVGGPITITIEAEEFTTRTYVLGAGGDEAGLDWAEQRHLASPITMEQLPGKISLTLTSSGPGVDLTDPQYGLSISLRHPDGSQALDRDGNPVEFENVGGDQWESTEFQPGEYQIWLNAHNHAPLEVPSATNWITVPGGDPTTVSEQLFFSRSSVTGTVSLFLDGQELLDERDGVRVELLDATGNPLTPVRFDDTNDDGVFTITEVEDGTYSLRATKEGFEGFETTSTFHVDPYRDGTSRIFDFDDEVPEPIELDAILHGLQVHVTSAVDSIDVDQARVQLIPNPQYTDGNSAAQTGIEPTNTNGIATFSDVAPGWYLIQVDSSQTVDGHRNAVEEFHLPFQDDAPSDPVEVEIQEGLIHGQVSNGDDDPPVSGSTVAVYTLPSQGSGTQVGSHTFNGTDQDFAFYVDHETRYRVVAAGPSTSYLGDQRSPIGPVQAGFKYDQGDLEIIQGAGVVLRVREATTGIMIPDATISWSSAPTDRATDGGSGDLDSGANGDISLLLPPDTYTFTLLAGPGYESADRTITLNAGSNGIFTISAIARGSVEVIPTGGTGSFSVRLTPGADGEAYSTHTRSTGNRVISQVRTGNYSVQICRNGTWDHEATIPCTGTNAHYGTGSITIRRDEQVELRMTLNSVPPPTTTTTTTTPTPTP